VFKVDSSPAPPPVAPAARTSAPRVHITEPAPETAARASAAGDSATTPDPDLTAPSIQGIAAIDSVTLRVEQSTKSKIDSAQRARIELKTPIFKKP
jgi:hypothetical protein